MGGQLHPCGLKIGIFSLLIGMRLMHSFMQQAWVGFFAIFAPLIAVLPFAASFITDRTSGYITFILSRTSFRRYRTSKYVANLLAGGVSTSLPLLVGYGIINIFYPRGFQPIPALGEAWDNVRIPWVNANGTFGYLY